MEKHPENTLVEQLKQRVWLLENHNRVLNNQNQGLLNQNQLLETEYQKLLLKNQDLSFLIDQYRRLVHGSKRERFISNEVVNQMILPFAENQPSPVIPESGKPDAAEAPKKRYTKPHPGRAKLPDHLPVEIIELRPEGNLEGLRCIGQEITDKLDITPARFRILRYVRYKYVKIEDDGQERILIADLPTFPIEKGIATASLLAQIHVDKFVDHIPFNRQITRLKREQIEVPSSTIDSWSYGVANLIFPVFDGLRKKTLQQGYLQVDETPIKVLDSNKKGKTHQGYYWVYHSPLQKAIFFDYQPGRGRDGPRALLKDFKGYLQSDGYGVYEWFGKQPGIVLQGCMAHARRYFEKSLDYDYVRASQVLSLMQSLYKVEQIAREQKLSPAQRKELRLEQALPVANELGKLMVVMYQTTLPKSPLGVALGYTITRWDNLLNYLYDGSLEIDNNLVENALRPNAIGRKNFLFTGSHEGARRAAMFYTLFATCKMHGVNPFQWLKKVLEVIPDHPANRIEELFPQNMVL